MIFNLIFTATSSFINTHITDKCPFNSAPSAQFTFPLLAADILSLYYFFSLLFFFSSELGISGLMRGQKVPGLGVTEAAELRVSHNTFLLKLINPDCARAGGNIRARPMIYCIQQDQRLTRRIIVPSPPTFIPILFIDSSRMLPSGPGSQKDNV